MGSKKNKIATTQVPKLKGGKAKEYPHIADALTKPLGDAPVPRDAKPAEDGNAAPAEATGTSTSKAKTKAKGKAKEAKPKRVSALDTAVRVLEEEAKPMNCKDL